MTYEPYYAGQRLTTSLLNESDRIGRPIFKATRDAAQSISSNATAQAANAISWDNVMVDLMGGWSAGNPTRWTAPKACYVTLLGGVGFASSAAGTVRGASWFLNGAAFLASGATPIANVPAAVVATADARALPVLLAAGDYIELIPVQNSGAALNTATPNGRPYAAILYGGTV